MGADDAKTLAIAGAVAVVGLVLLKYGGALTGALTGDNDLTRGAKNADGDAVSAYQGAGVLGTAGAAANAATGGYLASFGQWLGIKAYDLVHSDDTDDDPPSGPVTYTKPAGQVMPYTLPVSSDTTFQEASQPGYDWRGFGWGVINP